MWAQGMSSAMADAGGAPGKSSLEKHSFPARSKNLKFKIEIRQPWAGGSWIMVHES